MDQFDIFLLQFPSTSYVQWNSAALFGCEAPEMFD